MDLKRVPDEERVSLCRTYFYIGLFCLPFLWLVNSVWFFPYAFGCRPSTEQKTLKRFVILSMVGVSVWTVAAVSWIIIYQTNRVSWGQFGDDISFNIPRGIP